MNQSATTYYRHRFPSEIISHCVWRYFRFSFSVRDVEEMINERGVTITYETVREWCLKFGGAYAKGMRSPRPGDRWHFDEVFLKINGRLQYLWRAVDQDGEVLDIPMQPRRDKRAAKRFFRKLLKNLKYVRRVIITDKLGSYASAKAEVMPTVEPRQENASPIHAMARTCPLATGDPIGTFPHEPRSRPDVGFSNSYGVKLTEPSVILKRRSVIVWVTGIPWVHRGNLNRQRWANGETDTPISFVPLCPGLGCLEWERVN